MRPSMAAMVLVGVLSPLGSIVVVGGAGARPWPQGPVNAAPGDESAPLTQTRRLDYRLLEVEVLTEINVMRKDPAAYAERMRATRSLYRGNLIQRSAQVAIQTQEGVAALDEAVEAVAAARRLTRLAHAEGLREAARDHAGDLGQNNMLGHNGSDGSTPDKRISRRGTWDVSVAENIAFGPSTAQDIVMGLLIDDGVADRGHRTILLSNDLFFAGVGCGPHPGYGIVCVVDFATAFKSNHLPGPPRGARIAPQQAAPAPAVRVQLREPEPALPPEDPAMQAPAQDEGEGDEDSDHEADDDLSAPAP